MDENGITMATRDVRIAVDNAGNSICLLRPAKCYSKDCGTFSIVMNVRKNEDRRPASHICDHSNRDFSSRFLGL